MRTMRDSAVLLILFLLAVSVRVTPEAPAMRTPAGVHAAESVSVPVEQLEPPAVPAVALRALTEEVKAEARAALSRCAEVIAIRRAEAGDAQWQVQFELAFDDEPPPAAERERSRQCSRVG